MARGGMSFAGSVDRLAWRSSGGRGINENDPRGGTWAVLKESCAMSILLDEVPISTRSPASSRCRLHEYRLVDQLPRSMPRCDPTRPLAALAALQDHAWRELGRADDDRDLSGALRVLPRYEVCLECITTNIGDPHFRDLRRASGVEA